MSQHNSGSSRPVHDTAMESVIYHDPMMTPIDMKQLLFDTIIRNGRIVNGMGNPWSRSDIGIANGRISKIGYLCSSAAKAEMDAEGLVVSPGFIDMHSHGDLSLLTDPTSKPKVMQGVTTEVIGNCGFSAAPIEEKNFKLVKDLVMSIFPVDLEVPFDWSKMHEYFERLEKNKTAVNVAPLVGHGTLRVNVMGLERGPPTTSELEEMKSLLEEALIDGALGMSSGLIYTPGSYAETDELVELCKVVKRFGRIYASHIRGEDRPTLIEAVKEAVEIGFKSGVSVEISHHKAAGRDNWGSVGRTLVMIEQARREGLDVTCDVYPYTAGSTVLRTFLPVWVLEGGQEKMVERLKNQQSREKIKDELETSSELKTNGSENIMISLHEKDHTLEGKNLAEIANKRSKSPYDVFLDLLIADPNTQMISFEMDENDVRTVIKHHASMIGSDGLGIPGKGRPHPRLYGTFPRVLSRYAREERLFTVEEAIRKMTSFPAQKLGLTDRGLIAEGMAADMVIFDQENILDMATYEDPHKFSQGIQYVLVNGELTVREGELTGVRAGKVLKDAWS
mgnify:CR=1 FL=1